MSKLQQELDFKYQCAKERHNGVPVVSTRGPHHYIERLIAQHENPRFKGRVQRIQTIQSYLTQLKALSTDTPTLEQITLLKQAALRGPNYLGRVNSQTSSRKFGRPFYKTNGFTTSDVFLPSADARAGEEVHCRIHDLSQGALIVMLARHIGWYDVKADEFLSFSDDLGFLIAHAALKHYQDQGGVKSQSVDRRKMQTVDGVHTDFYSEADLCDVFKAQLWEGLSDPDEWKTDLRKGTHEWLMHGTNVSKDNRLQQVLFQDLLDNGLATLYPWIVVPSGYIPNGLYTTEVQYRRRGFPPRGDITCRHDEEKPIYSYNRCDKEEPMTESILGTCRKLALLFNRTQTEEPLLHIFLMFLSFCKRPRRDELFSAYIRKHYKRTDVKYLYEDELGDVRPGYTHCGDNLPSKRQHLDLVRDCNEALGAEPIPATTVETHREIRDGDQSRDYPFAAADYRINKNDKALLWFDEAAAELTAEKRKRKAEDKKAIKRARAKGTHDEADAEVRDKSSYVLVARPLVITKLDRLLDEADEIIEGEIELVDLEWGEP